MVTFNGGKENAAKEKAKQLARVAKQQEANLQAELKATGKDLIEYELAKWENIYRHSKYDFTEGVSRGNLVVKGKMDSAEKNVIRLKEELNKLIAAEEELKIMAKANK